MDWVARLLKNSTTSAGRYRFMRWLGGIRTPAGALGVEREDQEFAEGCGAADAEFFSGVAVDGLEDATV